MHGACSIRLSGYNSLLIDVALQVRTHRVYMMDCTVVSPLTLMLFGGELSIKYNEGHVMIDDWIRVRVAAPNAVLIKKLRQALDTLLKHKVEQPEKDIPIDSTAIVDTLGKMLSNEEKALKWGI